MKIKKKFNEIKNGNISQTWVSNGAENADRIPEFVGRSLATEQQIRAQNGVGVIFFAAVTDGEIRSVNECVIG